MVTEINPQNTAPRELTWAEHIAGSLAVLFMRKALREGKCIEIPSLGLKIMPDGTLQPMEDTSKTK